MLAVKVAVYLANGSTFSGDEQPDLQEFGQSCLVQFNYSALA